MFDLYNHIVSMAKERGYKNVSELCKAAGLAEQKTFTNRHRAGKECTRTEWRPLISPHQLRHNYATVLFEQDVDVLTAKDIMGHKDISTTQNIYTSLRQKHRDEEVKKIAGGF